ncbi:His/Gly/Thr/Pro-type tRNA ligase C-terminal domain-containing protein [Dyella silvatica]|uniref:His/Gly/Thr/Pro-type tRNA ligase C-terminal domain-containing protein n=1 Tax=Dyella silvatica TaxID=2992128 RepID=UPI00225632E0|nr:His/Gly/Thr/Pro-type tRNA ligase C-terminal domain-containing protein [Dyella silvatica]
MFCDRSLLGLKAPAADVDFDGDLSALIDPWSKPYAATEDVHDIARFEREVPLERQLRTRGIEVGQIFYFGTKYSEPMKALVTGPDGVDRPIHGGCYGVGVSRLLGAIIEACHDEHGIVWPDAVAPFQVGLINLQQGDEQTDAACEQIYSKLAQAGIDVLYDDTQERAGGKFMQMDLIGLPWQLIVGTRELKNGKIELKRRANGLRETLPIDVALARLL